MRDVTDKKKVGMRNCLILQKEKWEHQRQVLGSLAEFMLLRELKSQAPAVAVDRERNSFVEDAKSEDHLDKDCIFLYH